MRFQLRAIRKEFESKVKAIYGTLPCCDVFSVLHFSSNMRVDPRHTFSLTAYAKVIVINAFSVCDQASRQ